MIKRILFTLMSMLCIVMSANANITISPDVIESSIKQYFPKQEDSASALATFNANLENDGSISAAAIWKVCMAGSLNLDDDNQKVECRKFKTALEKGSNIKFFEVCKKDKGKSGGTEYCIDDVFNNSLYGGTQVDLTSAILLAKEYARVQHGDDSLICENKVYKRTPKSILARASDDYAIVCTSQNHKSYYDFWFDHIGESDTSAIFDSIGVAMCKIFNVPSKDGFLQCHSRTPEQYKNGNWQCPPISCQTDKNKCAQINQSLAKFGYMSLYDHDTCEIYFNSANKDEQLKTAFGINNFKFCKGIQIQNTPSLENYLQEYVAKFAGVDASEVKCNAGHRVYTGTGCSGDGHDDVKTCYVKGQQIDFVFDDINEWKDVHYLAGIQGMECIVHAGGTFDGKHCLRLTKDQCDALPHENLGTCSGCDNVEWDPVNNICKLKNAEYANDFDKAVKVAQLAGSVLLAVYGGWVAFTAVKAGSVAVVIPVVLAVTNAGGSILEFVGTLKLKGIATEFIKQSNSCENSSCADSLVKPWLERLSNIKGELEPAEYGAVNEELARLLDLTSNKFRKDIAKRVILNSPDLLEANSKGFFNPDSWEPEQVMRAIGIGLQLLSTIGSWGYDWWVEHKAAANDKMIDKMRENVKDGYEQLSDPEREALRKQLANQKPIDVNNGKQVEIPKAELESPFYGYEVKYARTGEDGFSGDLQVWREGMQAQPMFDVPSQYDEINKLETFIKNDGGTLASFMDDQANIVYTFVTDNPDEYAKYLKDHGIPAQTHQFSDNSKTVFMISEERLAIKFPEQATESPVVETIMQKAGDINFATTDTLAERQKIAKALSGAINEDKAQEYADDVYNTFIDIIASDPNVKAHQIMNFDTLSDAEKTDLANSIFSEYAKRKGMPEVPIVLDRDLSSSGVFTHLDKPIKLNPDKLRNAPDFLDALAHEGAGHAANEAGVGFLNARQLKLSQAETGVSYGLNRADAAFDDFYADLVQKVNTTGVEASQQEWAQLKELANKADDARAAYESHIDEIGAWKISDKFKAAGQEGLENDILDKVIEKGYK